MRAVILTASLAARGAIARAASFIPGFCNDPRARRAFQFPNRIDNTTALIGPVPLHQLPIDFVELFIQVPIFHDMGREEFPRECRDGKIDGDTIE